MSKHILGKFGLSWFIEGLLRCLFFAGILVTISLPLTLRGALPHLYYGVIPDWFYRVALQFTMCFGALMTLFVYYAARIFRTVNLGDPFVEDNLRSLSAMAVLCLCLCAACGYFAHYGHSMLALILALFFLFFGAFLLVLREVFRSAILFKEENDFTI